MRCWLVERDYDDKGLVRLVYATEDGTHRAIQERSAAMLSRAGVPAARTIDPNRLVRVEDEATRDRYAAEASRMRDRHDPDETV